MQVHELPIVVPLHGFPDHLQLDINIQLDIKSLCPYWHGPLSSQPFLQNSPF